MENNYSDFDIAIVGMAGRFPKSNNLFDFWQNLIKGNDAITFHSDEELLSYGINKDLIKNKSFIKAEAVLDDYDKFDAAFFGFSPRIAQITDPQFRIFFECAWEAFENAGYIPGLIKCPVGVFAGAGGKNYFNDYIFNNSEVLSTTDPFEISIGNNNDFLSTRLSYLFNLKGPSFTVQTACSTSLVSTHLACQSLLNNECDIAVAGGVKIASPKKYGHFYMAGGVTSSDGYCRAFDEKSDGFVNGSGVGIVILKRLKDAIKDRDCIHAIIKGTAINNDGSDKTGYTAPSINAQSAVIAEVQSFAEVLPDTITYIEAHGTGTKLGDPIEIEALRQAFNTGKNQYCAIGSVKTNIGHLDSAAGIAGLIKTVLMLKHKKLVPSLHSKQTILNVILKTVLFM